MRRLAIITICMALFLTACGGLQKKVAPPVFEKEKVKVPKDKADASGIKQKELEKLSAGAITETKPIVKKKEGVVEPVSESESVLVEVEIDKTPLEPAEAEIVVAPQEQTSAPAAQLSSAEFVDMRIRQYEDKLSQWGALKNEFESLDLMWQWTDEMTTCFSTVKSNLAGYRQLRDDNLAVRISPLEVTGQDINYLENSCSEILHKNLNRTTEWVDEYNKSLAEQLEITISVYADQGDHQGTISAFQELTKSFPDVEISANTKKIYGMALVKTGKIKDATKVFGEIVDDRSIPDYERMQLRRLMADLFMASGKINEAKKHYQFLADIYNEANTEEKWIASQLVLIENADIHNEELTFFMSILQSYLMFDGKQVPNELLKRVKSMEKTFAGSIYTFRAKEILSKIVDNARKSVEERLELVQGLVVGKEFQQALRILDELLTENISREMRTVVLKSRQEVVEAEKAEDEAQRLMVEQTLSIRWEDAINLMELRRYDEAVDAFTALLGTDYEEQAAAKIAEASNLASKDLRMRAANLFVKARKTVDPSYKRELLLESHKLLKKILEKYPDTEIVGKVMQNLTILEEQMIQFDPTLLQEDRDEDKKEFDPLGSEGG